MIHTMSFHADIFFLISAVGFIILLVFLIVICMYVLQILGTIRRIGHTLEQEIANAKEKLVHFENEVKENGAREIFALFALAIDWLKKRNKKKH